MTTDPYLWVIQNRTMTVSWVAKTCTEASYFFGEVLVLRNARFWLLSSPCFGPDEDAATAAAAAAAKVEFNEAQQNKVNSLVAEERRKFATQLEAIKGDKSTLEKQVNDLKTSYQTKEELASEKHGKELTDLRGSVEATTKERDTWKTRYSTTVMQSELQNAAVAAEAFNPAIIVSILSPKTELSEIKGEDGTATGRFESKVRMTKVGKDSKPVELLLSPSEAVKVMLETPLEYGSLFKSTAKGGLGNQNASGVTSGSLADAAQSGSMESFETAYRAKFLNKGK